MSKSMKFSAAMLVVAGLAAAQTVTNSSSTFGGTGASNCSGSGSTVTQGAVLFSYDRSTSQLTVVVNNTSPVVTGQLAPRISQFVFNTPKNAVTGMSLLSQTGAGGATPAWLFSFDADNVANPQPNSNKLNCYGSFNCALESPAANTGTLINSAGVGNASGSGHVYDSITFVFSVTGPGTQWINAGAFANSFSSGGGSGANKTQFGAKSQGMGFSEEVSVASGCAPTAYATGTASPGCHMDLYMSGATGCGGCLVVSLNPGPTTVGSTSYDIGWPFYDIISVPTNSGQVVSVPVDIPNLPELVGLSLYFSTGLYSPSTGLVYVAQSFTVTFVAGPCQS